MIEMSSVFKKKHKKIPPAFLHEGIFVTPRPYLNDIGSFGRLFSSKNIIFSSKSSIDNYSTYQALF